MKLLVQICLFFAISSMAQISFASDKNVVCGINVSKVSYASGVGHTKYSINNAVDDFESEGAQVNVCRLSKRETALTAVFQNGRSVALIFKTW